LTAKPFGRLLWSPRPRHLCLFLRLGVLLCKCCSCPLRSLDVGSRQQLLARLLQVLDEFLFLASLSKGLAPKDHAEVCSITRAVILTKIVGRNGYPDYCDQALAFSAILYPASHRHSLLSAFRRSEERRVGKEDRCLCR